MKRRSSDWVSGFAHLLALVVPLKSCATKVVSLIDWNAPCDVKRLLFCCASFHKHLLSAAHYFLLHCQGMLLGARGVWGTDAQEKDVKQKSQTDSWSFVKKFHSVGLDIDVQGLTLHWLFSVMNKNIHQVYWVELKRFYYLLNSITTSSEKQYTVLFMLLNILACITAVSERRS